MVRLIPVCLGLIVLVLLVAPTVVAFQLSRESHLIYPAIISATGLLLFALGLVRIMPARAFKVFLAFLMGTGLVIRLVHLGVVQFSGRGFTSEFFMHINWTSVRLGLMEYGGWVAAGSLGSALLVWLLYRVLSAASRMRGMTGYLMLLTGMALLVPYRSAVPEWSLWRGYSETVSPVGVEVSAERKAWWRATDLVRFDLPSKFRVTASANAPTNLIFLYLESVSLPVLYSQKWPQLMPNLRQLNDAHAFVENFNTSSYITIEGIVNTQCGTLFPFRKGSESLASDDGLAQRMPCLGDVLHLAGYEQIYLGGANLNFAGKGSFLSHHGYGTVIGQKEFAEQGILEREGTWGVSDPDLFDYSLKTIKQLKESNRPFNLTLLSIGTHTPGYRYEECDAFAASSDRFLNAFHCTDQLVGQWVESLRQQGLLDGTLLVITGDHRPFPTRQTENLFGAEAITDPRIPFIVIGDNLPADIPIKFGAGYDIAPTLLHMLGVEHNAQFALGRSLLKVDGERKDFFTRYAAIREDKFLPTSGECGEPNVETQVKTQQISACVRTELLSMLEQQVSGYSRKEPPVDCSTPVPIAIDFIGNKMIDLHIGLESQLGRFVWRGRKIAASQHGLYTVSFNRAGEVIDRKYYPESKIIDALDVEQLTSSGPALLVKNGGFAEESLPEELWVDSVPWIRLITNEEKVAVVSSNKDRNAIRDSQWRLLREPCEVAFDVVK